MKQTAVEWLVDEFKALGIYSSTLKEKCEQANAMHKEQIIDAFTNEDNIQWDKQLRTRAAEQYYNETFKSE
jgi:hypothetical protein